MTVNQKKKITDLLKNIELSNSNGPLPFDIVVSLGSAATVRAAFSGGFLLHQLDRQTNRSFVLITLAGYDLLKGA